MQVKLVIGWKAKNAVQVRYWRRTVELVVIPAAISLDLVTNLAISSTELCYVLPGEYYELEWGPEHLPATYSESEIDEIMLDAGFIFETWSEEDVT